MEHEMEAAMQQCKGLGVSKSQGYHFGVPTTRIIVGWGLYWGFGL